jgi:FemAB-related protein (PEP-CTERM system-associated)
VSPEEWLAVFRDVFGHRTHSLVVADGTLPLVEIRSRLFGHFLVSLPYVNDGGIAARNADAELALARVAADLARHQGASHIELRQRSPLSTIPPDWTVRRHKAELAVLLEPGAESLWDALSSRLRGKVRKAERNAAVFLAGGPELLREFYYLYSLNMRHLGTPVYARAFFNRVLEAGQGNVLLVRRDGRPAAGALALTVNGRSELPWASQDYGQSAFNANEFLYWNTIRWSSERGVRELDLGRSTVDAGTYRFKLQWNPEIRPLHWYYWAKDGAPPPQISPENPRYRLAIAAWKRLPLAVANGLGPRISRNIP